MIRYKDKIFPEYFIDPITAVITNSKGEVQKIYLNQGRPIFKGHKVYEWQMHTYLGYKKGMDIHHIDKNKMNNSLSNLVYLTHSEHSKIHGENMSEETKLKIGEASKGRRHSEETKLKISKSLTGKILSEETKQKMSDSQKGKKLSEETKRKIGEASKGNKNMLGKHHTEETKQKMSEASKGRRHSDETKKKMNKDFIKLCYEGFKKNDEKFPKEWTFEDYKKYAEECTRKLEKENEETSI